MVFNILIVVDYAITMLSDRGETNLILINLYRVESKS